MAGRMRRCVDMEGKVRGEMEIYRGDGGECDLVLAT